MMGHIPTPYDARIAEIQTANLAGGLTNGAELNHAYDMRRAWRLGYREGLAQGHIPAADEGEVDVPVWNGGWW